MHFITGEPALFFESGKTNKKTLVVTDLHIGIEYEFFKNGIKLPSQTEKMLERLEKLINETGAKKLIILGDIKHKVPGSSFQEEREIPYFLNRLKQLKQNRESNQGIKIEIVPGNHHPGLEKYLPSGVTLHGNEGVLLDDVYFTHGHTWPNKNILKAKRIVSGHSHPQFEFRDKLGYRWVEPVWLRAETNKKMLREKYKKDLEHKQEIIIVPTFNSFSGGYPVNRNPFSKKGFIQKNKKDSQVGKSKEFLGPVAKMISGKKKLYLLDGTFLGEF